MDCAITISLYVASFVLAHIDSIICMVSYIAIGLINCSRYLVERMRLSTDLYMHVRLKSYIVITHIPGGIYT